MTLDEFRNLKTGRMSLEHYVQKHYNDIYIKINNHPIGSNFKERAYSYLSNINDIVRCEICNKPTKFHGYIKGWGRFCSCKCRAKSEEVELSRKQTCLEKYGIEHPMKNATIQEKIKQTFLEKYGVDNPMKNVEIQEKIKQTCLEKYGVDNPMKNTTIQEKSKQTCLEKYDSEYVLNSKYFLKNKNSFLKKSRQTCLEKYGVEMAAQNPDVKNKISKTVKNKYGVDWACMRKEIYGKKRKNSQPNLDFYNLLIENNIDKIDTEYTVGNYVYDFRIDDNILIEINPSATHNVTWNPYPKNRITKNYHLEKSLNAKNNGYKCICVWDWDDVYKIINIIKNRESIYARNCIIKEVDKKECDDFLNTYHLQNTCKNQRIRLGLYHNNELVSVMTFGKPRYNKNYDYELIRLCSKKYVIGGDEKLFKYFVNTYNPQSIVSYCDNSKFSGITYNKLGFDIVKTPTPSCHWYNMRTKQHITNNLILQKGFDKLFGTNYGKNTSNTELLLKYNFIQIYDCGQTTYKWLKK